MAVRFRPEASDPSVSAGDTLSRGSYGVRETGWGTAGVVVRKNGKPHLLTAAHVLGAVSLDANMSGVYAPEFEKCPGVERDPVGSVDATTLQPLGEEMGLAGKTWGLWRDANAQGRPFVLDAALIALAPGTDWSNEIEDIGTITALHDLRGDVTSWTESGPSGLAPIPVRKYGHATQLTHGTITGLTTVSVKDGADEADGWVLRVMADTQQNPPLTVTLEVDPDRASPAAKKAELESAGLSVNVDGNTLVVTSHPFSRGGDSGAPVVDAQKRVLGLVQGGVEIPVPVLGRADPVGVRTNESFVMFIGAIVAKLGIDMMLPAEPSRGRRALAPGMRVERHAPVVHRAALDRARETLAASPAGARVLSLLDRHSAEVRELVHHRRRVMITWHRHKGPAFLAAVLRRINDPGFVLPAAIDGVRLIDTLEAMRRVLSIEGSHALQASIRDHGDELLAVARRLDAEGALIASTLEQVRT